MVVTTTDGAAAGSLSGDLGRLTLEQLKARVREVHDSITALEVSARTTGYDEMVLSNSYFHKEIVAQAPGLLRFHSGHGHDRLLWTDDPYQQTTYITRDRFWNVYPIDRSFFQQDYEHDASLPGTLYRESFFACTGLWPLPSRPGIQAYKHPVVLREVARSPLYSQVRNDLEVVRGRPCHILEYPGVDVLWIDVEQGCSLQRREFYDPESGALSMSVELGAHEEVAPGTWVPGWFEQVEYDHQGATAEERLREIGRARTEVLRASTPMRDEGWFRFEPTAGYLELSVEGSKHPRQTAPGGFEILDEIARWAARVRNLPADENGILDVRGASLTVGWLLIGLVGGVGISRSRRINRSRSAAAHRENRAV